MEDGSRSSQWRNECVDQLGKMRLFVKNLARLEATPVRLEEDSGRSSDCRIECVEKLLHLLLNLGLLGRILMFFVFFIGFPPKANLALVLGLLILLRLSLCCQSS